MVQHANQYIEGLKGVESVLLVEMKSWLLFFKHEN